MAGRKVFLLVFGTVAATITFGYGGYILWKWGTDERVGWWWISKEIDSNRDLWTLWASVMVLGGLVLAWWIRRMNRK